MAVYDSANNLIESFYPVIVTPGGVNDGADFGFSESSAIIKSFVLGDAFIVARNLRTESVSDVPEPGSMALLGLGLAGLVAARRRKAEAVTG